MDSYRSDSELKYYGSDLNKYISKLDEQHCADNELGIKHSLNISNIDCVIDKWVDFKRRIRFIESKHANEREMSSAQMRILNIIASSFKLANEVDDSTIREIFIVRGDPPYEEVFVRDLIKDEIVGMTQESFNNWLLFK